MNPLGIHLGIVVQNNDPEYRGRVKIFVPEHAPTIKGLTDELKKGVLLAFKSVDKDYSPEIANVIQDIKNALPWAEQASPLFAGCSSGRYNAKFNKTTASDSNQCDDSGVVYGFRPTNNWVDTDAVTDDFGDVNLYSTEYKPSNYSAMARGMFSIPNVGAHVYLFYLGNDLFHPVYFAASFGAADYHRIYTTGESSIETGGNDYPDEFENVTKPEDENGAKIFRSKSVINSNKNTIELVDTDESEMVKITHYSGSFKEFGNRATVELATSNDQKLVIGDQFNTIKGRRFSSINRNDVKIVGGDEYITIGNMTNAAKRAMNTILQTQKTIAEYKRLFPLCRVKSGLIPNDISSLPQDLKPFSGVGFAECPLCHGKPWDPKDPLDGNIMDTDWSLPPQPIGDCTGMFRGVTCTGETSEEFMKVPEGISDPGYYGGTKCPCCNNQLWRSESQASKAWADITVVGYSPSTANGKWIRDWRVMPGGLLDKMLPSAAETITNAEMILPEGGDLIQTISMSKIETIGSAFNDMPSFRTDPIGKLRLDGVFLTAQALVPYYLPCPHTEYVDVSDIPGGDYILTIGNKWKVNAGSKGISIQTTGPFDQCGTLFNINGIEINIGSKNDIIIDGGERLTLRARKITVNPVEHNALTIDGQLHVTRNALIKGGLYIDGELGIQHVTAPLEWHETEYPKYEPEFLCPLDVIIEMEGVPKNARLWMPQHKHSFATISMSLKNNRNGVRMAMVNDYQINSRRIIKAASTVHHTGIRTIYADADKLLETGENRSKIIGAAVEYINNNRNYHGHGAGTEGTGTGDLYYAAMHNGGPEACLTFVGAFSVDGVNVEFLYMTPIYALNHIYGGQWEKRYEMLKVSCVVGDEYEISNIIVTPMSAQMARTQNGECMSSDELLDGMATKYANLGV